MGKRADTRKRINPVLALARRRVLGSHPRCQLCQQLRPVTNAHSRKGFNPLTNERWLPDDPDHPNYGNWFVVAWLCIDCHNTLDNGTGPDPHAFMAEVITTIWRRDNKRAIDWARDQLGI